MSNTHATRDVHVRSAPPDRAEGTRATVYAEGLKKISALATDAQGRVWARPAEATDKDPMPSPSSPRPARRR